MTIINQGNNIPEKARLNRFLRIPIISAALIKTLFGGNLQGVDEIIKSFNFDIDKSNKLSLMKLKMKMVYYRYAYEFSYNEFFGYGFEHKTKRECLEYVSYCEYMRILAEFRKRKNKTEMYKDKRETYRFFKKYYKRDAVIVNSPEDIQNYLDFVKKHNEFIIKIPFVNNGNGIKFANVNNDYKKIISVFNQCLEDGGVLIEELINQPGILNEIYSGCVNTVRFMTYYDDGKLTKIAAMLKMGANGSILDKAGQGGLFAGIDIDTGIIITDGYTKYKKETLKYHPDSKIAIKGIQLPEWDKLLDLVNEIVTMNTQWKYVGWDFAYSDKGWVLIEGNSFPGLTMPQMGTNKGFRKIFSDTLFKESKYFKEYSSAKY